MRDYAKEFENRVAFIRDLLKSSGAKGVIYGNSGGKDSALVGILCKAACDNTVGIMMPCASKRNFGEDMTDGLAVAEQFNIETRTVDLTAEKELVMQTVSAVTTLNQMATSNIAPPAHAHALHHRRGRGPSRRRHRQPQRGIHGLFHEVGRRRV